MKFVHFSLEMSLKSNKKILYEIRKSVQNHKHFYFIFNFMKIDMEFIKKNKVKAFDISYKRQIESVMTQIFFSLSFFSKHKLTQIGYQWKMIRLF